MIKEIPILFSTPMVQAIQEGRKSHTRRILKEKHVLYSLDVNKVIPEYFKDGDGGWCPYGKPGDILWVRESYKIEGSMSHGQSVLGVLYKAGSYWKQNDSKEVFNLFHSAKSEGWRPSIHLPKIAARIWLKVESVRVERLKDISDSDAIAEGIESYTILDDLIGYKNYSENARKDFLNKSQYQFDNMKEIQSGPVASFCTLWISINGRESWISTPWVWVVSFKVLSTTGKPDLQTT